MFLCEKKEQPYYSWCSNCLDRFYFLHNIHLTQSEACSNVCWSVDTQTIKRLLYQEHQKEKVSVWGAKKNTFWKSANWHWIWQLLHKPCLQKTCYKQTCKHQSLRPDCTCVQSGLCLRCLFILFMKTIPIKSIDQCASVYILKSRTSLPSSFSTKHLLAQIYIDKNQAADEAPRFTIQLNQFNTFSYFFEKLSWIISPQ